MPNSRTALRLAAAAAALALLAGCESAAEIRQQDAAQCTSYGFKAGTDAFANCLQQESLARRYQLYEMQSWPGPPYWRESSYWWAMPRPLPPR
jgi:hypothetical protein